MRGLVQWPLAFAASLVVACFAVTSHTLAEGEIPNLKAGETYEFHRFTEGTNKPIHLGDGRGEIEDIPAKYLDPDVPFSYGWKFNLQELPQAGLLFVSIYSLVEKYRYDCPTVVKLNGKQIHDLRQEPYGSHRTTNAEISLKKENFQVGENKIEIVEESCRDLRSQGARNDSLVYAVRLQLF